MALVEPSVLANSVMGKLYDVLTNGDETVPKSDDAFYSWNTPGTPIDPSELEFLTQGFTGVVKKQKVDILRDAKAGTAPVDGQAPPSQALTPDEMNTLMAQDATQLLIQAENLSRLLDFVPDVSKSTNEQFARTAVQNNDGSLSDVYDFTLRMSQVMKTELPAETVQKIEKFRGLLQTVVKKKDLLTDEEVEVTEPSPLQKAYFEKMAAYEDAALEYNARRIDALSASDQRAVHDWAINANIYRNKVRAAMSDWVANGYKVEFEKIAAFIEQVSRRDMSLLKQQYVEDLERARLTGASSGSDFFYTSLVPGNFANSNGWTRFGFSSGDFNESTSRSYSSSRWQAKAAASFAGIFGGAGQASGASGQRQFEGTFDTNQTSMSFEIAQIPIARPWFRTAFLTSKAWRFDQNNVTTKGDRLSDGAAPPIGMMPAYPTTAIFVRKLVLEMADSSGLETFMSEYERSASGGSACVSLGPFNLGASASRSSRSGSSETTKETRFVKNTMYVDGMQLIGFKCHVMPKSPDPDPGIAATDWV